MFACLYFAWQTRIDCVAHFEPHNMFHPCAAVTEALRVNPGIRFVDPGRKAGADDVEIKRKLRELAEEFRDKPSKVCVVLTTSRNA